MNDKTAKFVFFGSSRFSIIVLDRLAESGLLPIAVVTTPDRPKGRGLVMTPTLVKTWARERHIPCLDPAKLDTAFATELSSFNAETFVVASYGKIIPGRIIDIPPQKTINIHPSLIPLYRGASPLQSAMLDDTKDTGVTIMQVDEQMDHGPIIAHEKVHIDEWPTYEDFEEIMAKKGADLLANILPQWLAGNIQGIEQDHDKATFTRKITKDDALIDLSANDYDNFRKIQAYHEWPQAYFFAESGGKKIRVKITSASMNDGKLNIEKVIAEGRKEMPYDIFRRSLGSDC